jgi:hypothetical protein
VDLTGAAWRTSSYSSANGGQCVQVANNLPATIAVRDSTDPHGPVLALTPAAWRAFTAQIKQGRLSPA